jgi:hypothetical protein
MTQAISQKKEGRAKTASFLQRRKTADGAGAATPQTKQQPASA